MHAPFASFLRVASALTVVAGCSARPAEPAPTSEPVAGFVDVPEGAAPYAARMFYALRPADTDAADAPLFVFWNGGPGAATTLGLLAYGTGPSTLPPLPPDDGPPPSPRANPRAFTRFANALYIDAMQAGFSYGRGARPDPAAPCLYTPDTDAADFLRVLLGVYAAHPWLATRPLVFVGESYGGTRATALLHALLHYRSAGLPDDLVAALQAHLASRLTGDPGATFPPDAIASLVRGLVLVEPLVLGQLQYDAQLRLLDTDPYVASSVIRPDAEEYDVRQPRGYSDRLARDAANALGSPSSARALLGVDLAAIPGLDAASRGPAFRLSTYDVDLGAANAGIASQLGALPPGDAYLAAFGSPCGASMIATRDPNDFVEALRATRIFVTHARYDRTIYTPAIPAVIAAAGWGGRIDEAPRPGVARPGWFTVDLAAAPDAPAKTVEVRYPRYDDSGHMVTVTQGGDLADDVDAWLRE